MRMRVHPWPCSNGLRIWRCSELCSCRHSLDPLAWELPCAAGSALKKKTKKSEPVIYIIYIYTHTLYIYNVYFFLYYLPLCFILRDWIWFPVLCSRISLFIYSKGNSLHLLTYSLHPIPSPSPLAATGLFSMSVSLFLFCR